MSALAIMGRAWKEVRESFFLSLANLLPRLTICDRKRYLLMSLAGVNFSGRATIWAPLEIRPIGAAGNVIIGNNTFLNSGVRLACPDEKITIGNKVMIGPRVCFETVNHGMTPLDNGGRGAASKPIIVEDNIWIGAGSIVLQGVVIGQGAVIAAGAVVNRSVEPYTLVAGVPACVVKHLPISK